MDENTTKLLENPHQSSHKTLYLLLVLLLVVVVSALAFLNNKNIKPLDSDTIRPLTAEERQDLIKNTSAPPGSGLSSSEQARLYKDTSGSKTGEEGLSSEERETLIKALTAN